MEDSSKNEILKAINKLEGRFDGLEGRFDGLEGRFDGLENRFGSLEGKFDNLTIRLDKTESELMEAIHDLADEVQGLTDKTNRIESQMVTRDYLDRKIETLRGDLVALSRKSNIKLHVLVEQMVINGTIKRKVADQILAMEPFPIIQMA